MTFFDAIKTCFSKYASFNGRAKRSEFWWFMLFYLLVTCAAAMIGDTVYGLACLAFLLPTLAVSVRRLHDTDHNGWWILLSIIPLANFLLLYWYCISGTEGANEYGNS